MPAVAVISRHSHLWKVIRTVLEEQRQQRSLIQEELSFFVYRSDTNGVLARGILGYEAAKERANQIRKQQGLPWSLVKFKAEPRPQGAAGSVGGQRQFGVSGDGKSFTNARGETGRVDYAKRYNPSKGRKFRGYTDPQGNYHDID